MKSFDVCECGAPLKLMERPTPKPTGSEVLLKVLAAGICHSDLHIWEGYYDLGGGKRLQLTDRGVKLPLTMGHENVGEVVAVGPDAKGVKVGDRRLVHPWLGCGECAICRTGEEQMCRTPFSIGVFRSGGYADHLLVPHPRYLFDIGNIPPERAAPLACSGITTYGALKKVGPMLQQEPMVIIGAGGLGLMCLALHKAMGGKAAIVVDIDPVKREAAKKRGAHMTIDPCRTGCQQADPQCHRGRHLGGDRSGRRFAHGATRSRQPAQGRQADHRRPVRRRYHRYRLRRFRCAPSRSRALTLAASPRWPNCSIWCSAKVCRIFRSARARSRRSMMRSRSSSPARLSGGWC